MKQPTQKAVMASALSLIFFFFLFTTVSYAQNVLGIGKIAQRVAELKQNGVFEKETELFKALPDVAADPVISATVKKYSFIEVQGIDVIQQTKPSYLSISIPIENGGRQLKVLLYKENISPNGFKIMTDKGIVSTGQDIVNYRGSIDNDAGSLAAITFANNEVSGFVSNSEGNFVIGKSGTETARHIIYNDADLQHIPFECGANTFVPESPASLARPGEVAAITTKCVNWYWETDYDLFVNKGSLANVTAYMQGVFNQMATLYANDGITMVLRTLFVWTTQDPYTGTSTSSYLDQFGAYRTSFDGDLAHLIGLKGGGGIAWINGACKANKYRMAYSGISSSYQTVPTYSWTVECITHEQGHLLGSQHTHDCVWNGNNTKIDGCGDNAGYTSGTCANPGNPAGGGTIMSYCHLLSGVGINFNVGFGPQPAERMINTINAASCLVACTTSCTIPSQPVAITGSNTVCATTAQTYSVAAVSGATSYTWILPTGWTGTSTTNSIAVTAGTTSGNITVSANNTCGSSALRTLSVTASGIPAAPASVTGNTAVCSGTSQTYTAATVAGAASYTWTLPSGWSGTSTTNAITATTATAGGQLTVKANNACGQGAVKTVALTITSASPSQPGTISGNTAVCAGSSQTYTAAVSTGAASYTWIMPSGFTGTSTTNSITVTAGPSAGIISVTAVNGCGSSTARTLAVTTNPLPATPGAITVSGGSATVCTGNVRTYTTPLVTGLTYNWLAPNGATITTGQGTNSIQITFTSSFVSGSSLSVRAANSCGNSSATSITISKATLATPGIISGPVSSCPNITRGFSVGVVSGATSYEWTILPGASFVGSATSNIIRVTVGTTSGNVTVKAVSACGTSAASTKYVTIGCRAGIENALFNQTAAVYPNPAKDMVTVRFNAAANQAYTISVADMAGRILTKKSLNTTEGINLHSLNISPLSIGTYLVIVQGKNSKETLKLTINK